MTALSEEEITYRASNAGKNAGLISVAVAFLLYLILFPLFGLVSLDTSGAGFAFDTMISEAGDIFVFFSNMVLLVMWRGGRAGRQVYSDEEDSWEVSWDVGMHTLWGAAVAFGLETALLEGSIHWNIGWWPLLVSAGLFVGLTGVMAGVVNIVFARIYHFFLLKSFSGEEK